MERDAPSPALRNIATTALLIAAAAYDRRESRGAHFRRDFPTADPAQARRTMMTLADARAIVAKRRSGRAGLGSGFPIGGAMMQQISRPDAFISPLAIERRGTARARRGSRPRRRRHLDRDRAGRHAGARRRGRAQGRHDRRPAAGRRRIPTARPVDQDRRPRARRRQGRGQDDADDGLGRRARDPGGRARRAQLHRPSVRHRHRDRRIRAAHRAHAGTRVLHPQDDARAARAAEIRGALRRRLQSPLRPR